ncbi:MAG: EAL domain-containing protein [Devosia sp.]|nr:EAL domain-containing protein [Devosia sp.]
MALIVMLGIASYAASQNQTVYEQRLRADVLKELSLLRAKLEGNINGNIQLVRGIVATISTEPGMSQARFADLASKLFAEDSQLRNIAAAPDLVVRLMYPLRGNESALGLDYRTNAAQRGAALRAMQTGEMVLAGPVELVQGGTGFIGRFPVFVDRDGRQAFWGIVSAVVDTERLYADSGLSAPDLDIEVAISGRDGLGRLGERFYGEQRVFAGRPVTAEVVLPAGRWVIAAIPKGGWPQTPPDAWVIWAGFTVLGLILAVPILLAGRLLEERQRNLKQLKSREAELQRLSRRLGLALETSQVGVFEYDLETGDLLWDDRINAVFGLVQDGGKRHYADWRDALHPDDLRRAEEEFRLAIEVTGRYHSEYRVVTPQGLVRNVRAIGAVYKDPDGASKIVGVNWDVSADVELNENLKRANRLTEARNSELEAAKASIEHNALHDSLTGLPNRRYLDDILKQRMIWAERNNGTVALLHIDLDRFKQINDTLGHAAGDAMLVHAAAVLRANVRNDDFVARIGGDEFVVVSIREGDQEALASLADRIITRMRQPVAYEGHECRFGVSIGIASERGLNADPERLLINADIALYRAKSRGRNRLEFFTDALQAEVIRTKRVADEILHALETDQFLPFYQPQFDAHTLEVVGVEALARWRHPTEGLLAPAQFLDVAEDLSVVGSIDRIVLEAALRDFAHWREIGLAIPKVSVNVSARRLQDEQLIASLRDLSIPPGTLSFELVESIFLDEAEDLVRWNIDQIKDLGIDVEIDDFGTGYASIVSLMQLKPRRLKIDRQLVAPIVSSPTQRRLVRSIVEIGRALDIEVVGEGVETLQHAEILRELGCSTLQGYAFARPLAAEALVEFVRRREWLPGVRAAAGKRGRRA